jgi:hypothetical protein
VQKEIANGKHAHTTHPAVVNTFPLTTLLEENTITALAFSLSRILVIIGTSIAMKRFFLSLSLPVHKQTLSSAAP